jgi:hypothetical protein
MKEVLKFDIKSNGLLSSIPYVSVLFVILFSGILSDKLIKSGKISRCNVRRIFNFFGIKFYTINYSILKFNTFYRVINAVICNDRISLC